MGMIGGPFRETAGAQEIAIIRQQLFEAGAGHVGQLDLHLLGGSCGHAPLDDVLLAGTGRPAPLYAPEPRLLDWHAESSVAKRRAG
jgi:hypothetical protein